MPTYRKEIRISRWKGGYNFKNIAEHKQAKKRRNPAIVTKN